MRNLRVLQMDKQKHRKKTWSQHALTSFLTKLFCSMACERLSVETVKDGMGWGTRATSNAAPSCRKEAKHTFNLLRQSRRIQFKAGSRRVVWQTQTTTWEWVPSDHQHIMLVATSTARFSTTGTWKALYIIPTTEATFSGILVIGTLQINYTNFT